jgi:hypothetical protein
MIEKSIALPTTRSLVVDVKDQALVLAAVSATFLSSALF